MPSSTGSSRGRELQKAQTPEGLREGWVAVQCAWQTTTVAGTPPDLVDAHVQDEWSLAQTLRHLIWRPTPGSAAGILRMQQPFHEIGQIFTGAEEMGFDMSIFRVDPPVYEEILAVRAERQRLVTDFLATATAGCSRRNARTRGAAVTGVPASVTAFA